MISQFAYCLRFTIKLFLCATVLNVNACSLFVVTKIGNDDIIYDFTRFHELIESLLQIIFELICNIVITGSE